jgi:hypothetical protein
VASDRVLDLYTRGIEACRAADERRARVVLTELMDALDFEFGDAASGLFRVYEDALRHVRKARFPRALVILTALRDACAATEPASAGQEPRPPASFAV